MPGAISKYQNRRLHNRKKSLTIAYESLNRILSTFTTVGILPVSLFVFVRVDERLKRIDTWKYCTVLLKLLTYLTVCEDAKLYFETPS